MNLPSLESLRCFVTAAKMLNFRKAAHAVALTPAAFGQRIKQLEEQFEVELFARTTRTVSLTEAGLALLPSAERCLEAAQECVRAAQGETGPAPMDIILGTRQELGMSWVLPQLDNLTLDRPWLQLHLYFGSGPDLLLRVRSFEIDCAITSTRLTDPKLDAYKLHREDYVFVGSTKLLENQPLTSIDQAKNHTLLDIGAALPLYRYWKDAPGSPDFLEFKKLVFLGSIEAIRSRLKQDAGVAVLPLYLVNQELQDGEFQLVFPEIMTTHDYFRLVFRIDDPRRSIFRSLSETLQKVPLRLFSQDTPSIDMQLQVFSLVFVSK
jgi:LysR family transcriptional regulator, glycine cleavage system transcriptional activator